MVVHRLNCSLILCLVCLAASLDDSLRFVRSYARGCVERGDVMDEILVPVIESVSFSFLNSYGVGNDPFGDCFFVFLWFLLLCTASLVYCFYIYIYTFRFCCYDFSGAKNNECVNKTATSWCLYWELPG